MPKQLRKEMLEWGINYMLSSLINNQSNEIIERHIQTF